MGLDGKGGAAMSLSGDLVEPGWLASHLGDEQLRILDVTVQITPEFVTRSGRAGWQVAHVPGSVFGDLLDGLSDRGAPTLMMMLPSAEQFATEMGKLGVGAGAQVVLYDARENMWAARVWWMLRAFGFDDAAVLDGGWRAWTAEGHSVCSKPCTYRPAQFTARPRLGLFVGTQDVLAAMDDPDTAIVSALGRRQHRGEINEYGRPGHIPGAKNVSAWAILDKASGRYRPLGELRQMCAPILGSGRVITYCGGGIAASSLAFALHRLGQPNIAVYDGGLLEWCADPSLPLEMGDS
jgi:thiosulfate/3-mercaptopyruvate sulfurtransferase